VGNILSDSFSFAAAQNRLRARYPEETANLTCLDTSTLSNRLLVLDWLKSASPEARSLTGKPDHLFDRSGAAVYDPVQNKGLILIDTQKKNAPLTGNNRSTEINYVLAHEHGHLILPNGIPSSLRQCPLTPPTAAAENGAENVADVFSAIENMNDGMLRPHHIRHLSLHRALKMWLNKDSEHVTSMALDALLIDHERAPVHSLAPKEVKEISTAHARRFAMTDADMNALRALAPARLAEEENGNGLLSRLFRRPSFLTRSFEADKKLKERAGTAVWMCSETQADRTLWLDDLISAAAQAPADSPAFYMPAKIAAHILNTGRVHTPYERTFDIGGASYDAAREMLREKSEKMGMPLTIYPSRH
jgi:hypothetical protein